MVSCCIFDSQLVIVPRRCTSKEAAMVDTPQKTGLFSFQSRCWYRALIELSSPSTVLVNIVLLCEPFLKSNMVLFSGIIEQGKRTIDKSKCLSEETSDDRL